MHLKEYPVHCINFFPQSLKFERKQNLFKLHFRKMAKIWILYIYMFGEGGVRFLQVLGCFFYIFCNTCFGEKDISFLLISHTALLLMQQHIPVI